VLAKTSHQQDTGTVNKAMQKLAFAIVGIALAGVSWLGIKRSHCKQRNEVFARQVEIIKQDASEELKLGAKKADVTRFFTKHSIPFAIVGLEAYGTLETSGCAPLGCGSDRVMIGIRVKLDETGAVAGEAVVVGIYADCV
jgi:hypothetical protein